MATGTVNDHAPSTVETSEAVAFAMGQRKGCGRA
jgi:hypothetical protein